MLSDFMKKALFVGRFQPLHIGHLKAIKWILKKCDKIIIVIGSSQESKTDKNPFSLNERKKMIENTLKAEGMEGKYEIIDIPDVHNDEAWIKNILEKTKFDIVFTMNDWTKRCFEKYKISVKEHPIFDNISGSKIREMIKNNEKWESLVPKEVEKIVKNRL
jgi:nicotinamide-nucleotide adenylyltransferase